MHSTVKTEAEAASRNRAERSDDIARMQRIARGDLPTFETLYKGIHPRLTRFVNNIVRRPHLVEEVVNDTMMVVWRKPEKFNGGCRLSTWIFAIAYRTSLSALRRFDDPADESVSTEEVSTEATPEQDLDRAIVKDLLAKAVLKLSTPHRTVVDLTYNHGMGYQEIAEIMDCPVDTVKSRMFYARRHLRQVLTGTLEDWI